MTPFKYLLILLLCTALICCIVFLPLRDKSMVVCTYNEIDRTIVLTPKENVELLTPSFEYERNNLTLISYDSQQITLGIAGPGIQRVLVKYTVSGHLQIPYIYEIYIERSNVDITQYHNGEIINSYSYH